MTTIPEIIILLAAIIAVESGGNPHAVGDGGAAVGILQIHPITVRDANRILRRDVYTDADRRCPRKSIEIFGVITGHYSGRHGASMETIARRWNGGPRGETKRATETYWQKVKGHTR